MQLLVERGFFPTAPNQPRLAISIDFLEFYYALFEHTGDAVTAITSALSKFYARRGFPVKNEQVCYQSFESLTPRRVLNVTLHQGDPIKDPFRRAFGSAIQWFDTVKIIIKSSIQKAIEAAHQQVDASRASPSSPTWNQPSDTQAARILQERCPSCFGGRTWGRAPAE